MSQFAYLETFPCSIYCAGFRRQTMPTPDLQHLWFGTRSVRFENGGSSGPQIEVLDDASDFATLTLPVGTVAGHTGPGRPVVDNAGAAWKQLVAFSGDATAMAALGINLADGVDVALAGQVHTTGDLRVGQGVVGHNIADIAGGGRVADTTQNLDGADDPVRITGHGRASANVLADAVTEGGGAGNYVTFSDALGFGFLGGSGWDPGGNALRLNDGESVSFEVASARVLAEASFTVRVLGGGSPAVVLDSDGRTVRDTNRALQGRFVQDGSAGELSLSVLADGARVRVDHAAREVFVNGAAVGGAAGAAFFAASEAAGGRAVTLGSAVGNQVGWSADDLTLAARDANRPPTADDDEIALADAGPQDITAALLDGNSDPEREALAIVSLGCVTGPGTAVLATGAVSFAADAATFLALGAGQTATASFAYTVADPAGLTATATARVTITGVNDPAGISGTSTGSVTEDSGATASGALSVSDPDAGEARFAAVPPAALQGVDGTFAFDAATGQWSTRRTTARPRCRRCARGSAWKTGLRSPPSTARRRARSW